MEEICRVIGLSRITDIPHCKTSYDLQSLSDYKNDLRVCLDKQLKYYSINSDYMRTRTIYLTMKLIRISLNK